MLQIFSRVQQSIPINRENTKAKVRRNHPGYLIFKQVPALFATINQPVNESHIDGMVFSASLSDLPWCLSISAVIISIKCQFF